MLTYLIEDINNNPFTANELKVKAEALMTNNN